ncbi:MAG: hypothetical protein E7662_08960 [Ruminococcaceae bacterium]|nr:hypothetical protein [Oscillospiraceae bacterium]
MKILANELILPIRQDRQCHASHFTPLAGGEIFCVYFYGTKEGQGDVRIFGSLRTADGKWSDPQPLSPDDGIPHWNPVLHRSEDGSVTLYYKAGHKIADWVTYTMTSSDNCRTWSTPRELISGDRSGGRGPVRNKILRTASGILLAPGSTEQGEWKCFIDRSENGGRSWERSADLRLPAEIRAKYENLRGKGIIQPTLWESRSGIHAMMRSSEGQIWRSDSGDGIDWCDPYPTAMPNNNSGIDAVSLPDGRVILACNPVGDNWGARTPISLYESRDNGRSFAWLTHLTTMQGEFSYPALRYEDDKLHITYTWNRRSVQYFCMEDV